MRSQRGPRGRGFGGAQSLNANKELDTPTATVKISKAKYSHYAVKVGRVPSIYLTWDECYDQVHGFPFSSFKGFKSLEEALQWMNEEPRRSKAKSAAKEVEKLSPKFYSKIGGGSSGFHAYQIPVFSTQIQSSSSRGPAGGNTKGKTLVETVAEPERGALIIEEQMELYLLRVCSKLHLGSPKQRYEYHSQDGEQHYRYSAKLVCEEAGINVEAHGCFSSNEDHARDDAAYSLLEMVLRRKGYYVCDYNYRHMCALQQQLEVIHGTDTDQLARRLIEKEAECELLSKQIEVFHKFLLT
ncbi:hypothetical protein PIB30_021706 [Stylosanthes scabra]|uniref:Ribonuclease H1 N-terminal domain-containing protein n=1 Tax=Stylosanthes scabra TaxID=79078 RepID=A0ABU6R9D0_9FABA|nr:hypothetical protein [Stylosanthes scabra]